MKSWLLRVKLRIQWWSNWLAAHRDFDSKTAKVVVKNWRNDE